jgi:sugar/nucleoside kinase (ribokinase family)
MKLRELNFDPSALRFTGITGTGGIGSGKFFVLNGDHTLGREESRSGHFLDIHDYCKQHIILYYVKVLLGPAFSVIPVGKIGDDEEGRTLFDEMSWAGFLMHRIGKAENVSTLFSFCFYYPDGSGGNLTTDNSASSLVDAQFIETAAPDIERLGTAGLVMAAPEVPLDARRRLLELGRKHGLFCTASFTSGEIAGAMETGIMENTDLVAINMDEASAAAAIHEGREEALSVVKTAAGKLRECNRDILLSVTSGKEGSWCWDGERLNHFPAVKTKAISTAGAGDAFFSGIICGLSLGLHLFDAQQLASLIAGLSVTSPDTIHKGIDRRSLRQFLMTSDIKFSQSVIKLLEE